MLLSCIGGISHPSPSGGFRASILAQPNWFAPLLRDEGFTSFMLSRARSARLDACRRSSSCKKGAPRTLHSSVVSPAIDTYVNSRAAFAATAIHNVSCRRASPSTNDEPRVCSNQLTFESFATPPARGALPCFRVSSRDRSSPALLLVAPCANADPGYFPCQISSRIHGGAAHGSQLSGQVRARNHHRKNAASDGSTSFSAKDARFATASGWDATAIPGRSVDRH